jgi:cell division transport system permease protein
MSTRATMASSVRHTRLAMWRHQHAWCARDSLRQILRHPLGSLLTIAVMGLALALPLVFYLLLTNAQNLATALGDSQSVSVFLRPDVAANAAGKLADSLRERADVDAVAVRTPRQGLAELAAMQGFGGAIRSLSDNPLPFVLLVQPKAVENRVQVETMVQALRALPQVDLVQDNGRWRARLDALIALGRRITLLLAVLLGSAAILVIGNTVRLDIRSRADEIAVQQLIGAGSAFVRRPYLYEGAWYGLAAGGVAVLLLLLLETVLAAPVRDLVASYAGRLRFGGLSWATLGVCWMIAIALGWLGALLASSHQLVRLRT